MALSATDKREVETIIRKEIKDFLGTSTVKQFENKLLDMIASELNSRSKVNTNVKDIVVKVFREFYYYMWSQRSSWEPKLKNA
jgi:hypothetical protein